MDSDADREPPPWAGLTGPPVDRRLVTKRRRERRPLPSFYWVLALVLVVGLVGLTYTTQRDGVQQAVAAEVREQLTGRGTNKVQLRVDGRDVVALVPVSGDKDRVERLAAEASGVASVETRTRYANAKQARTCADLDGALNRATGRQRIPFAGTSDQLTSTGQRLVRAAATLLKQCPDGTVVVGGHADESTPNAAEVSLRRARVMVAVLKGAGVPGSRLEARGYGDQFPVDEAGTPAAEQANQRGSITVGGL